MKQTIYFLLIIFSLGIFLYLPSVSIPFFSDEIHFIQRNEAKSIDEFFGLLGKKDYDGFYYRPVGNIVSSVITYFFSYTVSYYRIFNAVIHIVNALLIYFMLCLLLHNSNQKKIIALFASLFFIAFPLHDYAILWHTDLFDRILTTFYLSSFILFIRNYKNTAGSIVCFILALLSKESAFSYPLLIFALHFILKDRFIFSTSIKKTIPYVAISLIVILFRAIIFNDNLFKAEDAHSSATLLTIIKNNFLFMGMTIFPFYLREIQSFLIQYPYFVFAGAILFLFSFVFYLKKQRKVDWVLIFFILFFLITLLPASRLLMRWYLYLPSVGFVAALSYFIFTSNFKSKFVPVIISISIFTLYSTVSHLKLNEWIAVTNEGEKILSTFVSDYKDVIASSDTLEFLTLPAKVNDIPVYQLAFGHHLNFYLYEKKEIQVLSKSHLKSFQDSISTEIWDRDYLITNFNENNFILFDKETLTFIEQGKTDGKIRQEQVAIPIKSNQGVASFSFTNGRFYYILER